MVIIRDSLELERARLGAQKKELHVGLYLSDVHNLGLFSKNAVEVLEVWA